tara:strand:+ start:829 stop:1074 length:246 start_codon:yes stop_codon:yes gene_type:complete
MKKSQLKKIIKEEISNVLKEDVNDGSQYHIDQIADDILNGEFKDDYDKNEFINNIIRGLERIRPGRQAAYYIADFDSIGKP